MEQKYVCASVCDRLPTLSANHPWLVDQNMGAEEDGLGRNRDYIIYTIRDPLSQCRYQIPSFLGKRIRGFFYGWVILSNHPHNDMWSLWNPVASKIIRLPRLNFKKRDGCSDVSQQYYCLSSPVDEPGSVFMVTAEKYTIVFCRLDREINKLKWVKMCYAKKMRSITGHDSSLVSLTSCNSKVYALATTVHCSIAVVQVDIVVKGREIVISLLLCLEVPWDNYINGCLTSDLFLVGCCTELYYIALGLNEVGHVTKQTVGAMAVFKLDLISTRREEIEDLKDTAFFLDLVHNYSVFYSCATPSQQGGYIHLLHGSDKVIHSYHPNTKTIALSSMPTSNASLLELRLAGDSGQEDGKENEMVVRSSKNGGVDSNCRRIEENMLPWLPFDVLEVIMGFCVGVEYLSFRATCKQCHLAAPLIRFRGKILLGRLDTYSFVSPWLMVLDQEQGVISFTDPLLGDKYFLKTPQEFMGGDSEILCSMYGWLLIRKYHGPLCFFNPFTEDVLKLPIVPYLDSYYFTAPPISSGCMVVGFTTRTEWHVYIHFVDEEPSWTRVHLNFTGDYLYSPFRFATCHRRNVYALYNNGGLGFIDIDNQDYTRWEGPTTTYLSPKQNFLTKCDQQLLLVMVAEFGECVEVFSLNDSMDWERTTSLGRHAIYVCGNTCLCNEAKIPEMANKIYFPRLHSENGKIVFYSLETRRYHTFSGQNSFGDFMGTKHHLVPHVWIEPSFFGGGR